MNIRNVLRVYAGLRQLTDDETALLETLRGMSDAEHEAMVAALAPQKATKKPAKKAVSKSRKATSLAGAIAGTAGTKPPAEPICTTCGNVEDYVDHSEPSPSYHPFQTSASKSKVEFCAKCGTPEDRPAHHDRTSGDYHPFAPPVRSAASSSSPRNALKRDGESSAASSATGKDAAGDAHHAASGD